MLIGVLCEVVSATAAGESERMVEDAAKELLTSVFADIDKDGSGRISRVESDPSAYIPQITAAGCVLRRF